jgi:hypothetical protein
MHNEQGAVIRWLTGTPADRQHSREMAEIERRGERANLKVAIVGHVAKRAMVETTQTNLIRQEAERVAPDGSELYAMIAVAAAVEFTEVISRINRGVR